MTHSILITGASGYLGGTLLARWKEANLTGYDKLFALVRKPGQAQAVKQYGAEPLEFDIEDNDVVKKVILQHQITIVYFLIDAFNSKKQRTFIEALAEVKAKTGQDVHFLHTTGAKMFSSLTGAPTDQPLLDSDPGLFDIHKAQKAPYEMMQVPNQTNITITEEGEKQGVRTYIFAPLEADGKGEGFGNPISIQTVDVVTAAKGAGGVYKLRDDRPTWPVCHVIDNANLYIELLRAILEGENPDHGKQGFYLASSGSVA
ncbi:NAD dependent epimerase-like protein 7 [Elsinoe australis]|uniref:NAD dependent epimerase-like protein 7 n=1 Tax=Elsinoe australis TaxID=40998 RepID=A0A4V6DUM2_9PEZI|nr:NAD dependent epimerase-like protein 7 [Elsinoe australis]